MKSNAKAVTVKILDKEYRIACDVGEEDALIASARTLNERMAEVRKTGKVIGTDRIAVMVALNLAHELLTGKQTQLDVAAGERIRNLRERVEEALNESTQLEL